MIGVIANPRDYAVIREFFELFKTPWDFYDEGRPYEVLLCAGDVAIPEVDAKLLLIYAARSVSSVEETKITSRAIGTRILTYRGARIPIYGASITFGGVPEGLADEESQHPAVYQRGSKTQTVIRAGYDLFDEVRTLLTAGQPPENAAIPTLDLHIRILRDLIVSNGVRLVEIPPVPGRHRYLACLTHDVDHALLRRHALDHTILGFLYRATIGSFVNLFRGRLDLTGFLSNLAAAAKLPLVYFGLAEDIWSRFDCYTQIEKGFVSTFFVIPFKNVRGRGREGQAPARRATRYGAADISDQIRKLISAGCEIGTHGIDAWIDGSRGRAELDEIGRIAGQPANGIRMHWLYFDERSPAVLENAGADYDSTIGYNETIGYRAGTAQAYKPAGATRLLELPLHVMDTALFYPSYMDLSPAEARQHVGRIIQNAVQSGGCVTVNWHDRSIAPERLWGGVYAELIDDLERTGAWFATARQAVSWFRKRRSAAFEAVSWKAGELRVTIAADSGKDLPPLNLRVYDGRGEPQDSPICGTSPSMNEACREKYTLQVRIEPMDGSHQAEETNYICQ